VIQLTSADVSPTGSYTVFVTNPNGGSPASVGTFNVIAAPAVSTISPSSATVGDPPTNVTVTGSGFISGSVVMFNGAAHNPNPSSSSCTNSAAQLCITLTRDPDLSATAGLYPVTVNTPTPGGVSNNNVQFTLNNPMPHMALSAPITPASVAAGSGGQTLTVTGTDFLPATTVTINGQNRATYVSPTQLSVSILATETATAGTIAIAAVNAAPGGGSAAAVFTVNNPTAAITALTPNYTTAGGAAFTLTVNGTSFVNGASVQVSGANRTTTFVSATQLTASIPASDIAAAGTLSITVLNPAPSGGTSPAASLAAVATSGYAGYLDVANCSVIGGWAWNSSLPNSPINVDLYDGSALLTTVSANLFRSDLPGAGIGNGYHAFSFAPPASLWDGKTHTIAAKFGGTSISLSTSPKPLACSSTNPVPSVSSISPSNAIAGGAAFTLTVNGTNFVSASVVQVNGSSRTTTFVSATQLTASVPASDIAAAGTLSVTVVNPAPGGGTSAASTFTVNNPVPAISSLSPNNATAGGAAFTLTVNGTNFVSGTTVKVNGSSRTTTFVSATQVTASIPASDIASAGALSVTVVNPAPGGGTSAASSFTVNSAAPVISSLSPQSVAVGGPDFTLTISGSNFVSGATVQISDLNGTLSGTRSATFVSSTQLTVQMFSTDIATADTITFWVVNPQNGGCTSGCTSNPANMNVQ